MIALRRGVMIAAVLLGVALIAAVLVIVHQRSPSRGLPYHDSFARDEAGEWKAFGGTWAASNGVMRNDSDERGAKLITGSTRWRDYMIEADVMILGAGGDAGLIVRSSDEEEGVDAYTGYYAGIRNLDHMLVLGRAGHGWAEVTRRVAFDGQTVMTDRWYHLRLIAVGCQLTVIAESPSKENRTVLKVNDSDCIASGRAGLRSYGSGGEWRNIVIRQVTEAEVAGMLIGGEAAGAERSKAEVADIASANGFHAPETDYIAHALPSNPKTQPISSLTSFPVVLPQKAVVRGTVVLTSPGLYVQDSGGGVLVKMKRPERVRVGDEIEVSGLVRPGSFSATMENAEVRVLWGGSPMPALSVTAAQAATGRYDSTFVEAEGRLRRKSYGSDGTLSFELDSGSQEFRALLKHGDEGAFDTKLEIGSLLRIRGVSVVDAAYTGETVPFTLLVRSTDDVTVAAGPPWWSAAHLVALGTALLLLAVLANYLYHRVNGWRLRAIAEEREHLAYEMHDTLAQGFAGIGFQLEAIRTGVPEEMAATHRQVDLARELVRHSHAEARRTVDMLRPQQLESQGLLHALQACAQKLVAGGSVAVVAKSRGEMTAIPLRISDNLYRIGQEALANAVRHAHPQTLSILLEYERDAVRLSVRDDGVGFVVREDLGGFGVLGMRKRAASIGARLEIQSEPGAGTEVAVMAALPQRITVLTWPRLLYKFLRERYRNASTVKPSHTHPYRR
ncbi:MAG TPA: histidine kinase [Acidobacteriaceae bacterium]|nr:histidine kinase [Acidobacteriaceae bacterium]